MFSTFFTLPGFEGLPAVIASTRLFSRVHDVVSLKVLISSVKGSDDDFPQIVPDAEHAPGDSDVAGGC